MKRVWIILGLLLLLAGCQSEEGAHLQEHAGAKDADVSISLETIPEQPLAGEETTLAITVNDRKGGAALLIPGHERILHAAIVSEDLDIFGHVHPEDSGVVTGEMRESGRYTVRLTFPRAGGYLIAVDLATADGEASRVFPLTVQGEAIAGYPATDMALRKDVRSYPLERDAMTGPVSIVASEATPTYTVTLAAGHLDAGVPAELRFRFEQDDAPLRDMEPYLGAGMHLLAVKEDLSQAMHLHGTPIGGSGGLFGPDMLAETFFGEPGRYALFAQAKHNGSLIIARFMVEVEGHEDGH